MNTKYDYVLVGSDPEFFVTDPNNMGLCIPSPVLEKLGIRRVGTEDPLKPDRHPFFYQDDVVTVMADGAAMELTFPPSISGAVLYDAFQHGLEVTRELVKPLGFEVSAVPYVPFILGEYQKYGIDDPLNNPEFWMAVHFGCDPQFVLYEGDTPSKMVDAKEVTHRTAGGHIHIGFDPNTVRWQISQQPVETRAFIQLCDILLGTRAIGWSPYPEEEMKRQEFYGKPGNHRVTTYKGGFLGWEYRTPSVSWLTSEVTAIEMVDTVHTLATFFQDCPGKVMEFEERYLNDALRSIRAFDQVGCQNIYNSAMEDLYAQ